MDWVEDHGSVALRLRIALLPLIPNATLGTGTLTDSFHHSRERRWHRCRTTPRYLPMRNEELALRLEVLEEEAFRESQ
jgi:hypothetical protein